MATVTPLPHTCTGFYLSGVSEMDDIKALVKNQFEIDQKRLNDKKFVALFTNVVRPAVVKKLEEAGFKKLGEYKSHRHNTVVQCMARFTTLKEWKTGIATFPKVKKAAVVKAKAKKRI